MSKKDAYKKMLPSIAKYTDRYASEVLHEPVEELQKKAQAIYDQMYAETPEIGGANNPMADNLYGIMTFFAYYEASDHRIGEEAIALLGKWRLEDQKAVGKIFNLNHKSSIRLANWIFKYIVKMTDKKKAKGEWGNTWKITLDTKKHPEGFAYTLYGCPLLAFAKKHGYENIMPRFCEMDHLSAALMHGKLIRFETEATGGSCCDYWFVGDKSESAKKYADLPIK